MTALIAKLPMWVKAVVVIGPTAWIAIMLADRIPKQLDALSVRVEAHAMTAGNAILQQSIVNSEQRVFNDIMIRLQRQICVNGAKSEYAIQKCLE